MENVIITDISELTGIREDWNNLLQKSNTGNVFFSWEWVTEWWRHFGGDNKLFIIIVNDSDEMIGIAPFMIVSCQYKCLRVKCLTFLGQTGYGICPDHLDIISSPGLEREVSSTIINTILDCDDKWDKIDLSEIPQNSFFINELKNAMSLRKKIYNYGISSIAPYVKLRSQKNEKDWKYYHRRLAKNFSINLEFLFNPDEVERGINICQNLLINSAKRNNRISSWENVKFTTFHRDVAGLLAKRNELCIVVMYCDDQPVSVLYGYINKNKYLLYSTGFDATFNKYSVGQVIIGNFLEYLTNNGLVEEFDFLRGDEDYKYKWTDTHRENAYFSTYSSHFRGLLFHILEYTYNQLKYVYRTSKSILHR